MFFDCAFKALHRVRSFLPIATVLICVFAAMYPATGVGQIVCEGSYGGHLQGFASDGDHIYWSFTVDLVKTDMDGRVESHIPVETHHGDCTVYDGRLYVAVNHGAFNEEPGKADSWIYVYDTATLGFLQRTKTPEAVHGAGGMAYHDGRFIVVGGLPVGYTENYLYEYTTDLTFVKRYVLESGFTTMGIQTACYGNGYWWFGCYGSPKNSALLQADENLNLTGQFDTQTSVGFEKLPDGMYLQGVTTKNTEGAWTGTANYMQFDPQAKGRFIRK